MLSRLFIHSGCDHPWIVVVTLLDLVQVSTHVLRYHQAVQKPTRAKGAFVHRGGQVAASLRVAFLTRAEVSLDLLRPRTAQTAVLVNVHLPNECAPTTVANERLHRHVVALNVAQYSPLLAKRVTTQWAVFRAFLHVSGEVVPCCAPAPAGLHTQAALERLWPWAHQYVREQEIDLLETSRANAAAVCTNHKTHISKGRVFSLNVARCVSSHLDSTVTFRCAVNVCMSGSC